MGKINQKKKNFKDAQSQYNSTLGSISNSRSGARNKMSGLLDKIKGNNKGINR